MPHCWVVTHGVACCTPCGGEGRADHRPELPLTGHRLMRADVIDWHGVKFYAPRDAGGRTLLALYLLRSGEFRGGRLVPPTGVTVPRETVAPRVCLPRATESCEGDT